MADTNDTEKLRSQFQAILNTDPKASYKDVYQHIARAKTLFHEEMAKALQPMLNAEVSRKPINEFDDKRTIAGWIMDQLRPLHLAVRCPKTGEPSAIIADIGRAEYDLGRFRFEVTDDRRGRIHTYSATDLPTLTLCEGRHSRRPYRRSGDTGQDRSR